LSIANNLKTILKELEPTKTTLVAVSKTHPPELIMEAYNAGQRIFGENKVQEMTAKYDVLPKDIRWHLIGHLQTNKVKFIAPFVSLIHAVDSFKLLEEINKEAAKNNRVIDCLLQIYIAKEETKFGLSFDEASAIILSPETKTLKNIRIIGLMGMATLTENKTTIRNEFKSLKQFYD
jgi:pyridoxal phosphate enzyme (YggS family)